ncbi:HK97-gp10 family putative phage morphogenesis protein [Heliorestis convoluta]|uniref:Phage protein, HK97 gp10 family n=1 Tax=Heliorestis convoluta TaxID=356322 RepID=A0A5Q2MXK3_9FIRM|nr:HK97-gp10 family putative phage morphogenesis protein [Heliorestis convoluta]QGG47348.1 Phage protein, HK97 gp10 family [Heliorestis convoluta]
MTRVELEGVNELLRELEKLGQKGSRIENSALRKAGDKVQSAIQEEAPTRTGTLKRSIRRSNVRTEGTEKYVKVDPGKEGWYGRFVEFGTVKMSANPFMSRGYEKSKKEAAQTIASEMRKGLGL